MESCRWLTTGCCCCYYYLFKFEKDDWMIDGLLELFKAYLQNSIKNTLEMMRCLISTLSVVEEDAKVVKFVFDDENDFSWCSTQRQKAHASNQITLWTQSK